MDKPKKPNVARLLQACRDITERANQFNMGDWYTNHLPRHLSVEISNVGGCGTAACIAGFGVYRKLLEDGKALTLADAHVASWNGKTIHDQAVEWFGLTGGEAAELFYSYNWPPQFGRAYANAKTPKQTAAAAVARIKHFIKTGE